MAAAASGLLQAKRSNPLGKAGVPARPHCEKLSSHTAICLPAAARVEATCGQGGGVGGGGWQAEATELGVAEK